jgi:hypothetical protein
MHSHISRLQVIQRCHWFTHFIELTVTHALEFSVFTNRFVSKDLEYSHCHFKSHMKSSFHSPIRFLPFFWIAFDCHLQNSIQISTSATRRTFFAQYNPSARNTQKTRHLYFWEGLLNDPLPNNGRPIVARDYFRRNVFTESFTNNGNTRQNILSVSQIFGLMLLNNLVIK